MWFLTHLLRKTYEKNSMGIHHLHGWEDEARWGNLLPFPSFVQFYLMPFFSHPQSSSFLVPLTLPTPGLPTVLWFPWHLDATCWSPFSPPVLPLSLQWSSYLSWPTVSTNSNGIFHPGLCPRLGALMGCYFLGQLWDKGPVSPPQPTKMFWFKVVALGHCIL